MDYRFIESNGLMELMASKIQWALQMSLTEAGIVLHHPVIV